MTRELATRGAALVALVVVLSMYLAVLAGLASIGYYVAQLATDHTTQQLVPGYDDCTTHPALDVCYTVRVP